MLRFSLSTAFRRKGIAVLAIVGTSLGCALMTVLLSTSEGMNQELMNTMNRVATNIVVSREGTTSAMATLPGTALPAEYADEISDISHVESAYPQVTAEFRPVYDGEEINLSAFRITLTGIDDRVKDDPYSSINIVDGKFFEASGHSIIMGQLAFDRIKRELKDTALGEDFIEVGSILPIKKLDGLNEEINITLAGIFESDDLLANTNLYTRIDTARAIMGLSSDQIGSVAVRVDTIDNVDMVNNAIKELYMDSGFPVDTVVAKDVLREITGTLSTFRGFITVIAIVAAIAGGLSIFIVMLMSVVERTREFGILKATGWSNSNIIHSVIIQSVVIALLGAVIGLAIGFGVTYGINLYLIGKPTGLATVSITLALFIIGFGIFMGLAGGLYPAIKAAKVSPINTLKGL